MKCHCYHHVVLSVKTFDCQTLKFVLQMFHFLCWWKLSSTDSVYMWAQWQSAHTVQSSMANPMFVCEKTFGLQFNNAVEILNYSIKMTEFYDMMTQLQPSVWQIMMSGFNTVHPEWSIPSQEKTQWKVSKIQEAEAKLSWLWITNSNRVSTNKRLTILVSVKESPRKTINY